MALPRVLFAGPEFPAAREYLAEILPGIPISYLPDRTSTSSRLESEVLIPLMTRVDGPFIERSEGLRLIQQWGAGLEGVDHVAANARGIAVGNVATARSGGADSVAEWCVMAALVLSRRLPLLDQGIRSGATWGGPIGRSLFGKTAGIVGLGGIGRALAQRLAPFGMDLVGVTRAPDDDRRREIGLKWLKGSDGLEELLAISDFVFLCLPLLPESRHLIDGAALARMRRGACLINPGRGGLINEESLESALADGRLGAAGLDVFASEPLPLDHPLLGYSQVMATPHIAGITDSTYRGIAVNVAEALRRLSRREPLDHCVNWEDVKDRFYS